MPLRVCLWIMIFCMTVSETKAQQQPGPTPAPSPRTGRAYSVPELPSAPPSPGPQAPSPVTFTDITAQTGIRFVHAASPTAQKYLLETMGAGVAMLDYDNDGRLDLFIARYLDWDFEKGSILCGEVTPGARAFCHPDNFKGVSNVLYHQLQDGSFEDVTAKAGMADPTGKALGVAFADFDNDGLPDVFVANDSVRQSLYRNKGDGTFEDVAVMAGAGYDENGKTFAGMGVDAADFDNDGYPDVFITTLSNETYPLYHNNGDLTFTYTTNSSGVGLITLLYSGWGTHSLDADNDGWRDLFVAQGHVLDTIEKTTSYLKYNQTPLLMRNTGKGFVNIGHCWDRLQCSPCRAWRSVWGPKQRRAD
jgi:enediyne biosynthesis protein E4